MSKELIQFAQAAAEDIFNTADMADRIEVTRDDMIKWGTLLRQTANELAEATRTDQDKANTHAETIITARGRDLHDFLTKYQGTPGEDALLFSDLEPEEGELTAAYVSVVPVSILSEPVTADTAVKYPTIRVGTKLVNAERPVVEAPDLAEVVETAELAELAEEAL